MSENEIKQHRTSFQPTREQLLKHHVALVKLHGLVKVIRFHPSGRVVSTYERAELHPRGKFGIVDLRNA